MQLDKLDVTAGVDKASDRRGTIFRRVFGGVMLLLPRLRDATSLMIRDLILGQARLRRDAAHSVRLKYLILHGLPSAQRTKRERV